jgi:superfamily II DNA or RNA helicase
MQLRSYQLRAVDATFKEWEESSTTLGISPTGCGKTVIFSEVIRRAAEQGKRSMVLAHRQELVFQARDKIKALSGLEVEVEMGERKVVGGDTLFARNSCVVSTIQTHTAGDDGGGRMTKFDPNQFGVLILDEAHHCTSPSYRRVIDYYRTNPELKVLGVTATPDRTDEEALGQVFETVAFDYEILDAIRDGWLVPIDQQMIHVEPINLSGVKTTAGDLNGADLAAVMETEKALHGVAYPTIEIIGQKRCLVFTSSVAHAKNLSEIFNRHRSGMSSWVCGETDADERAMILADFKRGKIQVVCNCAVLTEGFDDAGVEVIAQAKPTKSRSLYAQMIGRATRPLPGIVDGPVTPMGRRSAIASSAKHSCLIIDFVGNSGKHKLMTTANILGGKVSDEAIESAIIKARQSGKAVRMDRTLEEEEEINNEKETRRLEEEARKAKLVAKANYKTQSVNPFDMLQIRPVKERGWDKGKTLTEKQTGFLRRAGIDPDSLPYSKARQLIGAMVDRFSKKLCTIKQMQLLKKYGCDTNVTFEQASLMIDEISKNGWKKPAEQPKPVVVGSSGYCSDDDVPF